MAETDGWERNRKVLGNDSSNVKEIPQRKVLHIDVDRV